MHIHFGLYNLEEVYFMEGKKLEKVIEEKIWV
jgi:hypothetical protein